MSLLTSRVTVNDNNGGTQVSHTHSFSSPLGFYSAFWIQPIATVSHVFYYVDVVTREHPRVGKHSDPAWVLLNSVLGNSLASLAGLLFTVDDVSDPTISTVFMYNLTSMSTLFLCSCVCKVYTCQWVLKHFEYFYQVLLLPDWSRFVLLSFWLSVVSQLTWPC